MEEKAVCTIPDVLVVFRYNDLSEIRIIAWIKWAVAECAILSREMTGMI